MSAKLSFLAFLVSLAALLLALSGTPSAPAHSSEAVAPSASLPAAAPVGQSGALYVVNHGNWG